MSYPDYKNDIAEFVVRTTTFDMFFSLCHVLSIIIFVTNITGKDKKENDYGNRSNCKGKVKRIGNGTS